MAACTKAVRRRSVCQAWVGAEGIHQRHHAQRLEASTSVGADALECRTVSTAVVGECPREWAESGLSGQVLASPGKTVSLKVSTTVDTNCPPGRFSPACFTATVAMALSLPRRFDVLVEDLGRRANERLARVDGDPHHRVAAAVEELPAVGSDRRAQGIERRSDQRLDRALGRACRRKGYFFANIGRLSWCFAAVWRATG